MMKCKPLVEWKYKGAEHGNTPVKKKVQVHQNCTSVK